MAGIFENYGGFQVLFRIRLGAYNQLGGIGPYSFYYSTGSYLFAQRLETGTDTGNSVYHRSLANADFKRTGYCPLPWQMGGIPDSLYYCNYGNYKPIPEKFYT